MDEQVRNKYTVDINEQFPIITNSNYGLWWPRAAIMFFLIIIKFSKFFTFDFELNSK